MLCKTYARVGVIFLVLGTTLAIAIPSKEEMVAIVGLHEVTTNEQVTDITHKLLEYVDGELQARIEAQQTQP